MPELETPAEKRLRLKKEVLSRAIAEGRGPQAIARLNALHRNFKATRDGSDDDIVGRLSADLTGGRVHVTMHDLAEAASITANRWIAAFNMRQTMLGTGQLLRETAIMPGTPTVH